MVHIYHYTEDFILESGSILQGIDIAYCSYGSLNAAANNVVWICHALTASAEVADWWPGVVGNNCIINPEEHFIICANILGSCYGTTGPLSKDRSGRAYYSEFPKITIRDMVRAHRLLCDQLQIKKISLLVGGSMGGYQAMEWTLAEPDRIEKLFLLATSARESAWGIAIHTAQRLALEADQSFGEDRADAGAKGLKAARAIGMLTYRSYELMEEQQSDYDLHIVSDFKAESYIRYQGDKLVQRFNAYSYYVLAGAMDSHNIARGRFDSLEQALQTILIPVLIIGITKDMLCPVAEQQFLSKYIPHSKFVGMDSPYGHDGFLTEVEKISHALRSWWMPPPK